MKTKSNIFLLIFLAIAMALAALSIMITSKKTEPQPMKIKMDNNINLQKGLELLSSKQYYPSIDYFENYIVESNELYNTISGLMVVTFGQIKTDFDNGIEYFKIDKGKTENNLSLYGIGVYKILTLEDASSFIKKFIDIYDNNISSYKKHYILAVAYLFENNDKLFNQEFKYLNDTKHYDLCKKLKKLKNNNNLKEFIRNKNILLKHGINE